MAETNEKQPGKRKGCGFGCAALIAAVLCIVGFFCLIILMGIGSLMKGKSRFLWDSENASAQFGKDEMPEMKEIWSSGNGDVKVVRIPLTGMILLNNDSPFHTGTADQTLRAIRRATHDKDVKGLLLEIDSGGGGVTASDILYQAVKTFKAEEEGRFVVAIMGDVAASGAYYVALAADRILAHPTTITGSIGVIMQSYNVKALAEKLGVSDVTLKSGKNKDLLNMFQDVNEEQKAIVQKVIDASYDRFVSLVVENRNIPKEKVLPLADGRIFSAVDAVEKQLIDGIGYFDDARRALAKLLKEEDVEVYRYEEEASLMDLLSGSGIGFSSNIHQLLQDQEPRLMYRMDLR
ncbi:MAG: signal peptide peptidase SppA [Kiritimatiellae bacterium]|nr:signal peptide peptidase SppA [Kiritimatiellia bacterium]